MYSRPHTMHPRRTPMMTTPLTSNASPLTCVPCHRHSAHSVLPSSHVRTSSAWKSGTWRKTGRELTSPDGRWYPGGAGTVATMLSAGPTVSTMSARVVPLVVAGLRAAKADVATVLSRLGVSDAEPLDSDTRISHALAFDLFEAAVEVTGDQAFGLHAAEQLRPGTLGTVDYLVRCSPTLGEALLRARRYQRLIQDAELGPEACAGRASQRYALRGGFPLPRPVAECVLAGAVVWTRQLTGAALNPLERSEEHTSELQSP